MEHTILVVDDEEGIVEILEMNLIKAGYSVLVANSGTAALKMAKIGNPDLVLLDVGLPDINGFEVCRTLREESDIPVLMVTARGEDPDRVGGLEAGADDYILKPFLPKEVLLRIKAVLRRRETSTADARSNRLVFEDLEIDLLKRRTTVAGNIIDLSPKGFDLLSYLISKKGAVLTRDELLTEVWGSTDLDARTVDVHVRYLRERLSEHSETQYIHTVWGQGYRLGDNF